jgi:exosortase
MSGARISKPLSSVLTAHTGRSVEIWPHRTRGIALDAVVVTVAILLLFGSTVQSLAGFWHQEDHSYSPFILLLAAGLLWRQLRERNNPSGGQRLLCAAVMAAGLIVHLLGRLLGNISIEAASALLVIPGAIGCIWGWRRVLCVGYPLAMLIFAIPLPGSLIVTLTFPLKMAVSKVAALALELLGLPVARHGVILELGNYRLLVADACSGLQSMFSLAAAALLYLALAGPRSPRRSFLLLLMILPMAFAANVFRVFLLAAITYYFGEAAGQGFLHWAAGMVMFVVALGGLMATDTVAELLASRRGARV